MTNERILERTEELEAVHLGSSVLRIRAMVPTGTGSELCEDCGNEIPEQRQAGGYTRCVGCVELEEARNRQLRGLGVRT